MAQSYDLPFVMFETNSASCGGFAGISDSFGSALWALDYGLQMAYSNFTTALLYAALCLIRLNLIIFADILEDRVSIITYVMKYFGPQNTDLHRLRAIHPYAS
jgi:hypothetical protein